MPCKSWSLPAEKCKTGSKLAKVKGSICSDCYALKGNYRWPNVKAVRYKNLDGIKRGLDGGSFSGWIKSMAETINNLNNNWFRWFDSGDLQSIEHLSAIVSVAEQTPKIKHWLPTHEKGMVLKYIALHKKFPPNLTVRISAAMVDGAPTEGYPLTSTVHRNLEPLGASCKAPKQGGKCLDCRMCWNQSVKNVSYEAH